ncbi:MAG TPA: hypothetical protein PK832_05385, partial [Anaerolineae bacterium]|nr:hypothetical protein [Anaerolineae bacterium]
PALRRGKGKLFLWGFAGGLRPPAKPLFFSPFADGVCAVGEGLGEGQKLQLTKVHPSPSSYLTPG